MKRDQYFKEVEKQQVIQNPTLDQNFDDMRFALVEVMGWIDSYTPDFIYEDEWFDKTAPFAREIIERTAR